MRYCYCFVFVFFIYLGQIYNDNMQMPKSIKSRQNINF